MRTLFMGMPGPFSRIVLERLLANNIGVAAVLLNGPRRVPLRKLFSAGDSVTPVSGEGFELPLLNSTVDSSMLFREEGAAAGRSSPAETAGLGEGLPTSLSALAFQEGIPTYECGEIGHQDAADFLAEMLCEVVCVACWNRVIPSHLLDIPQHGFLNVHPSILPEYRGPYPIFWQYRAGERTTGVSVHWMDAGLDTGDIAGQRELQFRDGIRGSEAEALCASSGGDLLAEVLVKTARGEALRRPQPAGGSYFPVPSQDDFAVDPNWQPRRAFNFMRANAEWGVPFRLESEGSVRWLADALEWREGASPVPPGDGKVWTPFRGGEVLAVECSRAAF